MTLNCKPGDLAMVVRGVPVENIGRVVSVDVCFGWGGIPCWSYYGRLVSDDGFRCPAVADDCLRPIRGQDGDDETLAWTGLPATHDAQVTA